MSEKQNRDNTSRLSAGHLGQIEEENWDDTPTVKTAKNEDLKDSDLEQELFKKNLDEEDEYEEEEYEEEEDEDDDLEEGINMNTQEVSSPSNVQLNINTEEVLQQITSLQNNLPALEAALNAEIIKVQAKRREIDIEEAKLKSQMNMLRALSGKPPLEEEMHLRPRRGRKPRSATDPTLSSTDESGEAVTRGRGGRGKRFKNEQTLKQAIAKSMMRMQHPTNGKKYTGFVKEIAQKVISEEGYKTTSPNSSTVTNTVRAQLYRLTKDNVVIQNEDGSYSLSENAVNEMNSQPSSKPETATTE